MKSSSKMKKAIVSFLSVAAVVVGSIAMTAAPASAAVYNCTTGYSSVGAFAKCLTADRPSTDKYRVRVLCQNIFTRQSHTVYGNWVTVNSSIPSTVQGCPAFEAFYGQPGASNA